MTNKEKLAGFLGLCRKAGKLTMGFDEVISAMQKGVAEAVLLSSDASERTARNIKRIAEDLEAEVFVLPLTTDEVGYAVSKRAAVLCVCESGFSKKIKELLCECEHEA